MSGEAMGLISERERKRKSRNLLLMFVSSCDQISSYLVLLFLFLLVLFTDGIGDEEAPTRQFGPVRVLPSAVSVSCHDGPATAASASEEELPSKTRESREGDHRLIRSDSTRSQAWCNVVCHIHLTFFFFLSFCVTHFFSSLFIILLFLLFIAVDHEKVSSGAVRPTFDVRRTWFERQPGDIGFVAYFSWHGHHPSGINKTTTTTNQKEKKNLRNTISFDSIETDRLSLFFNFFDLRAPILLFMALVNCVWLNRLNTIGKEKRKRK